MTVALETREDVAVFRYPAGYDGIVDEFDDLLERRDTGRLGRDRYIAALEDLVARHPWFIDGHAHLGNAFFDRGRYERALEAYERGYSLGTAALPTGFEEFIEWKYLENRPFLLAAHGLALCRPQLGRTAEAISVLEKMLAWNPDDHQGCTTRSDRNTCAPGKRTRRGPSSRRRPRTTRLTGTSWRCCSCGKAGTWRRRRTCASDSTRTAISRKSCAATRIPCRPASGTVRAGPGRRRPWSTRCTTASCGTSRRMRSRFCDGFIPIRG